MLLSKIIYVILILLSLYIKVQLESRVQKMKLLAWNVLLALFLVWGQKLKKKSQKVFLKGGRRKKTLAKIQKESRSRYASFFLNFKKIEDFFFKWFFSLWFYDWKLHIFLQLILEFTKDYLINRFANLTRIPLLSNLHQQFSGNVLYIHSRVEGVIKIWAKKKIFFFEKVFWSNFYKLNTKWF